ncbi:homeobox protein siamois-like [Pelobates fuscus]|uniref:homeobox protein siamois-like n=1 Tax=Pelobates fuscus TaxID=191477 RepID=UPI002FE49C1F
MSIDAELDHILSIVLSLEEDYPTLLLPQNVCNSTCSSGVLGTFPDIYPHAPSQMALHNTDIQEQTQVVPCLIWGTPNEAQTSRILDSSSTDELMYEIPGGNIDIPHNKRSFTGDNKEKESYKRQKCVSDINQPTTSRTRSAKRTQFSEEQTTFLLNQFILDPYPDFIKRCHIANITQIPEPRIQVWFQNRRARHPQKSKNPDCRFDF